MGRKSFWISLYYSRIERDYDSPITRKRRWDRRYFKNSVHFTR